MTLSNSRQKINDCLGNPVEIGIAVMWRVRDTAKAVFNVDNYKEYLSLQCDSALRNIVRLYPYDVAPNVDTTGDGIADEGSLRGSSEVVAERIKQEIQSKVEEAGLEIVEARITYLAYAPEIAAVMLQRQQASAIIDARKMIVDGAVGMVEMALERLNENDLVTLDDERKAVGVRQIQEFLALLQFQAEAFINFLVKIQTESLIQHGIQLFKADLALERRKVQIIAQHRKLQSCKHRILRRLSLLSDQIQPLQHEAVG